MFIVLLIVLLVVALTIRLYVYTLKNAKGANLRIAQVSGVLGSVFFLLYSGNFLFGHKFSDTYRQYQHHCSNDTGVQLLKIQPTEALLVKPCLQAYYNSWSQDYTSYICKKMDRSTGAQSKEFLKLTPIESAGEVCKAPMRPNDWMQTCFTTQEYDGPVNYYELKVIEGEHVSDSSYPSTMRHQRTGVVDEDQEVLAASNIYTFFPQGNGEFTAFLQGIGSRPGYACGESIKADHIFKLFPPARKSAPSPN